MGFNSAFTGLISVLHR